MFISKLFMTLGHIAMYEALEILKIDITSNEGKAVAYRILERMNKKNKERTDKDSLIRNVEGIPGESAAVTLCLKDKLRFKNNEYKLYSNQYIPLIKSVDLHERLELQGYLDSQNSGGAIAHINVDSKISKSQMKDIILYAAKCGVIYFAVNMVFSRCKTCNALYIGKLDKSPCHNAEVLKFIRVVGFLTQVSNWNKVRRDYEFDRRQLYGSINFDNIG
jgi:ribonucleoside-triphosphate reductase